MKTHTVTFLIGNIHSLESIKGNSFPNRANEAGLTYITESTEYGEKYVIDFSNIDEVMNPEHPLIQELKNAITPYRNNFSQIILEWP